MNFRNRVCQKLCEEHAAVQALLERLMQTIARANRRAPGKSAGVIVDYVGVFQNLQKALAIYWRALTQEGRLSWADALKDWRSLLNMPPSAMTPEMRSKAEDHIRIIVAQAATPRPVTPSATSTPTPTHRPGSTATPPPRTPTPGS